MYAYADDLPQRAYYIACAADKVYCAPTGHVEWKGFSMTLPFIKTMLDRLEIQPQIFYAGKFKSATEPLRDTQMTEANRLQSTELLNDIYSNFLSAISHSRQIDTATLRHYADSSQVLFAREALANGLVDGVKYDDEVKEEIRHKLRIDSDAKINFVSMSKYAEAEDFERSGSDKIAVIYAEGNIVDGTGDRDRIGGETYRNYIRRARTDKSIKAIVIRINSGGGSAGASEQMWREVVLVRKEKPVIVSFGDVAASGGYYMACAADSIFVQPNTITGSIGVFGILPNMQNFFRKKLGITFDEVSTSPGGSMSITKPLTPLQKKVFQTQIDSIYSNFKSHVASGRKKPPDYIETIAQGRVWSGTRAVQIGLADRIGSLDDAITAAAAKAKISDYRLREYPGRQSLFEMLFSDNKDAKKETMIREELGTEVYKTYSTVKNIQQMIGQAQARMPFEIVID